MARRSAARLPAAHAQRARRPAHLLRFPVASAATISLTRLGTAVRIAAVRAAFRLLPFRRTCTPMDHTELAWEFAELFAELEVEEINEVLAKNVPMGTLDFFHKYGEDFGRSAGIDGDALKRLPNLLLMGYLIRVLEERLIEGEEGSGA
jgi:hypothetical protein